MKIIAYVNFDGDCREAFERYANIFGARIDMMLSVADTPAAPSFPPERQNQIMHARLSIGGATLMGSDWLMGPASKIQGATVSLNVNSVDEAERIFAALAEGGTVTMPLQKTFWAEQFGMLTDKSGVPFMINCEAPPA